MANDKSKFEGWKNPKEQVMEGASSVLDFTGEAWQNLLFFKRPWRSLGFYITTWAVFSFASNVVFPGAIGVLTGFGQKPVSANAPVSAQLTDGLTRTIIKPVVYTGGQALGNGLQAVGYVANQSYVPGQEFQQYTGQPGQPGLYGQVNYNPERRASFIVRSAFSNTQPQDRR
jgi:hypothetical protein